MPAARFRAQLLREQLLLSACEVIEVIKARGKMIEIAG